MRELRDVRDFEDDLETSVVILTGSAKAFSAGFDLKGPRRAVARSLAIGERIQRQRLGPRMYKAWQDMEQVTIAAIEGHCVGGGAALVVALDFRTCGRSAHFAFRDRARHEHELGLDPAHAGADGAGAHQAGGHPRIGSHRCCRGSGVGLVVENVVEDGQALPAAMTFAERIARQPPIPVRMTKTTVNRLAHALDDLGSHMDSDQNVLTGLTEDYREGTSAFREKRKPVFRDGRDSFSSPCSGEALRYTATPPQQSCYGVDIFLAPPRPWGRWPRGPEGKAAIEILPSLTSESEESRLWSSSAPGAPPPADGGRDVSTCSSRTGEEKDCFQVLLAWQLVNA